MQSVPITADVSSNLDQGEVYNIVIKFVSDLRQGDGFLMVLHQYNWPPRYNWNIVESGVQHHQTNIWHKYGRLELFFSRPLLSWFPKITKMVDVWCRFILETCRAYLFIYIFNTKLYTLVRGQQWNNWNSVESGAKHDQPTLVRGIASPLSILSNYLIGFTWTNNTSYY